MTDVFDFSAGDSPLLISIPHDGRELMPGQEERMTEAGRAIPDTDWHVRQLYGLAANLGASVIAANYSRYVVDLNRPADDEALYAGQVATGLCPLKTFAGEPIYEPGREVSPGEQAQRIEAYWRPYHDKLKVQLDRIHRKYGYALLWDAHSIAGAVPLLFDGALPDLNIGTNGGKSCDPAATQAVAQVAAASPYSSVLNGRFRGGYITRHYGNPGEGVLAIQLELAQRTYMDEASRAYDITRATALGKTLRDMLTEFTKSASKLD